MWSQTGRLAVLILSAAAVLGGSTYGGRVLVRRLRPAPAPALSLQELVEKLALLPGGEIPTVGTVTDVSKLKDQNFFRDAKDGDRVLIYTRAVLAVLYRPSEGRIVALSPVDPASLWP